MLITAIGRALPPDWPHVDGELSQAFANMVAIDSALSNLHKQFEDDADEREDYRELEERRDRTIETLITVPASSMVGIQAKASALRLKVMIEDWERHGEIAVSLAEDLALLAPSGKQV
jgi:hypothetical protein